LRILSVDTQAERRFCSVICTISGNARVIDRKRYAAGFSHSPASHITPIVFPKDFTWRKSTIGNYFHEIAMGKRLHSVKEQTFFRSPAVRLPIVKHKAIEGAESGHEKSASIVPLLLRRDTPSSLIL
jgi:hypothetical protein